jgi:recombinase
VIARIVKLRRAGESYRAVAATLDAEGLRPRRAASWSAMAVRNIAQREILADVT